MNMNLLETWRRATKIETFIRLRMSFESSRRFPIDFTVSVMSLQACDYK